MLHVSFETLCIYFRNKHYDSCVNLQLRSLAYMLSRETNYKQYLSLFIKAACAYVIIYTVEKWCSSSCLQIAAIFFISENA